ncbi:MAG: helix-turn-helix transcriptional regulator [Chitinophagaceae bacterium]
MEHLKILGADIRKRMKLLKITQNDLASITGLSNQTIGAIVRGKEGTSIKNWLIVANALGTSLELITKKMSDETRESI